MLWWQHSSGLLTRAKRDIQGFKEGEWIHDKEYMKIKCHARLNLVQTDCQFFLEKYLGSAGKELSYQLLQKWSRFVKKKRKFSGNTLWNILDSFATPLQKKIHTIYTSSIKPSIYIYMNLKAIFSCFNNCFAAAASATSTSLLQLRVWWPLTNERVT